MRDRYTAVVGLVLGAGAYCILGFTTSHHVMLVRALIAMAAGTVLAALVALATNHARLVRNLMRQSEPTMVDGIDIRTGPFGPSAFVCGLVRPTIFCGRELVGTLPPGELRAVLVHERAHQLARDPLRLLLLRLPAGLLRRWQSGREWLEWLIAEPEIRADRYALTRGVSRPELARALLATQPTAVPGTGFTTAVDLRLQALLDRTVEPYRVSGSIRRKVALVGSTAAGAALCAWFLHDLLAGVLASIS